MTRAKLVELRQRMMNHDVEDDTAIVKLTAKELDELLDYVQKLEVDLALMKYWFGDPPL
jgi:hypothetical protein